MARHTRAQIEEFFREIDQHLNRRCRVEVIGGAVIALVYKGSHATTDVDLFAAPAEFWSAYQRATASSPHPVPVQMATIAQPPYDYEDRLERLDLPGLRQLELFVPERHDLALMKAARGQAHDLDAIEDIHQRQPLNLLTLIDRFKDARTQVIGSMEEHRLNFLAVVARLFGEDQAYEVEKRLNEAR